MLNELKPPLGVSPHWFTLRKRMIELNEAIQRYLEYTERDYQPGYIEQKYNIIAKWAEELKTLALLEARLTEMNKQNH